MKNIILVLLGVSNIIFANDLNLLNSTKNKNQIDKLLIFHFQETTSSTKGVLSSLIVPGLGEYLVTNSLEDSKYSISAEVSLWLMFTGFYYYGSWKYDDAVIYSSKNANVVTAGKDYNYFVIIGNYESIDAYNEEQMRNRLYEKVLDPATHYWKWEVSDKREKFRNLRIASDDAYDNLKFITTGIILNHLVSALHAKYLTSTLSNQKIKLEVVNRNLLNPSIVLNFSYLLP